MEKNNTSEKIPNEPKEYTEYLVDHHQEQTISNRLALCWLSFFVLFIGIACFLWGRFYFLNSEKNQMVSNVLQTEGETSSAETRGEVKHLPQWVKSLQNPDSAAFLPSSFSVDQLKTYCYQTSPSHSQSIVLSGFSPDYNTIFTIGSDNNIIIWDAKTGQLLHIIPIKEPIETEEYLYADVSIEGNYLVLGRKSGIEIYNISSGSFYQRRSWNAKQIEPDRGFLPGEVQTVLNIWHSCFRLAQEKTPQQEVTSTLFKQFQYATFPRKIVGRHGADPFPSIWNSENISLTHNINTLEGYDTTTISPDGMRLAAAKENEFAVLSIKKPENVWKHEIDAGWRPAKIAFSGNGLNLCLFLESTAKKENNTAEKKTAEAGKSYKIQIWDWDKRIRTLDYPCNEIQGISVSPDASQLVVSQNNSPALFEIKSQKIVWPEINTAVPLTVCPDGTYAVQTERSVDIVEPDMKTRSRQLEYSNGVSFLTVSSDGKRFAGIRNGGWITWNGRTGARDEYERKTRSAENRLTVCTINEANKGQLLAGNAAGALLLIDTRQKKNLVFPQKHKSPVLTVACTSDGKRVISGANSGKIFIQNIGLEKSESVVCNTELNGVYSIALSEDNAHFAAGDNESSVIIIETSTGKIVHNLKNPSNGAFESLIWSKDGQHIIGVGKSGNVLVWSADTGEILHKIESKTAISRLTHSVFDDSVYGVGFFCNTYVPIHITLSQTGRVKSLKGLLDCTRQGMALYDNSSLAVQNNGTDCIVWSLESGEIIGKLSEHKKNIVDLVSAAKNNLVYTLSEDNTIKKWNAKSGKCLQTIELPTQDSAASTNAAASRNGQLNSAETACLPVSLAVSPDEKSIAVGLSGGIILVQREGKWITLSASQSNVLSLDWNQNGKELVSAHADGAIRFWDFTLPSSQDTNIISPVKTLDRISRPVWNVKYSPRGDKIVSVDGTGSVCVWTVFSGECAKKFTFEQSNPILCADWSSDGETIALGDSAGYVSIWRPKNNQILLSNKAHSAPVWFVQYTRNGKRIVSSGSDMKINVLCL